MFHQTVVTVIDDGRPARKGRSKESVVWRWVAQGLELGFGARTAVGDGLLPEGCAAEWFDWGGPNGTERPRYRLYEIEETTKCST